MAQLKGELVQMRTYEQKFTSLENERNALEKRLQNLALTNNGNVTANSNLSSTGEQLGGWHLTSLRSQVVTSKQPKLGLTQELFFGRISESTTGYTFTPCVGSFTSPDIDTR